MSKETRGTELMRKIQAGEMKKLPTDYVQKVRSAVSEGLEEFLDYGARVRPLILEGKRIGWIRGVHLSERKLIQRWSMDLYEFAENLLKLGTTLDQDFIDSLTATEMQGLIRLLKEVGDRDLSLFPYLFAFSTTSTSYRLWCSRGRALASFENREVPLPDGRTMKILVPSDHARFWAQLCTDHDKQVDRNEASMNAAMLVRTWAGDKANGLTSELRNNAKALSLDLSDPWENVVKMEKITDLEDGWAHAADDVAGLTRELQGMMANDRHERLIAAFEEQQKAQATKVNEDAKKRVAARGGPGIVNEKVEILTDKEITERNKKLKKGKAPKAATPGSLRDQGEGPADPRERFQKYK